MNPMLWQAILQQRQQPQKGMGPQVRPAMPSYDGRTLYNGGSLTGGKSPFGRPAGPMPGAPSAGGGSGFGGKTGGAAMPSAGFMRAGRGGGV